MKNLFNSFYSIVLLALCLIAFSNCSDSDDEGKLAVRTMESLRLVLKRKRRFHFMERLLRSRLRLQENGLLLYNTLQDRTGRLLLIPVVVLLPVKEDSG